MSFFYILKNKITDIFYSFPVQLLVLHLRSNLILLGIWLFLALLMLGTLGKNFGVNFLFLSPEYLGEVNWMSFFILGLTFGSLFMSWNLTTYLLSTHYFPFLATLKRPFTKFCLNNALIPTIFFFLFLGYSVYFQIYQEITEMIVVFKNIIAFVAGTISTMFIYAGYFQLTNRDIDYFLKKFEKGILKPKKKASGPRGADPEKIKKDENRRRVDTYLTETLTPRPVRSVEHYDNKLLLKIFQQHHLNSFYLQLGTLILLMCLGWLMDFRIFRIPAGASIFILSSITIAFIGAITYWLHRWRFTMLILFLFLINYVSRNSMFSHDNQAYGLEYHSIESEYSYQKLRDVSVKEKVFSDKKDVQNILDNWREKFEKKKPKMIITTVSGGGLKAAVWAMTVLQSMDTALDNNLMKNTTLMTGASGGMIGTAYYRSLFLEKQTNPQVDPNSPRYMDKISKDLLNSICFSIVSNDLFLPYAKFKYKDQYYTKDRGYMFEKQLNENTDFLMDKPLGFFQKPEQKAEIPMLIVSPSIVNDARRLLISPQNIAFLTTVNHLLENKTGSEIDAVDFRSIFKNQEADSLRFTTALRMNATYPFILPNVHLPSEPVIEVMDAGFRDNMGILSASRFIQTYSDWILENTSGVVLVQINTMAHGTEIPPSNNEGIIESLLNPLGIFGHILRLQDYEHDANLSFIADILGKEYFDVIRFNYRPSKENERASMTFHLTEREKNDIKNSILLPSNSASLEKIKSLISE